MPTGESRRDVYKPGEPLNDPDRIPVDEGTYQMVLKSYGKKGLDGWKKSTKPGKFHSRMLTFAALGTQDERSGSEKTVVDFLSASPKAWFRIRSLAAASRYPEELKLPHPAGPTDTQNLVARCQGIDKVLEYLLENNVVLTGTVRHEEYKGKTNARIDSWEPGEEGQQASSTAEPQEDFEEEAEEEPEEPRRHRTLATAARNGTSAARR